MWSGTGDVIGLSRFMFSGRYTYGKTYGQVFQEQE
jgi:hypothetical protein